MLNGMLLVSDVGNLYFWEKASLTAARSWVVDSGLLPRVTTSTFIPFSNTVPLHEMDDFRVILKTGIR